MLRSIITILPHSIGRHGPTTGFPLTALKLSQRIIKGMSGGVLLKAQ